MQGRQEDILGILRQGTETADGLAESLDTPADDLQADLLPLVKAGLVAMTQAYWPDAGGPAPAGWLYSLTARGRREID